MGVPNNRISNVDINKANKRCRSCIYGGRFDGCDICDYILIAKHMRGCPGGDDCTRYVRKKRRRKVRPLEYV